MKILSRLPERQYYLFLGQKKSWYVYQDIDCPIVKIHSRVKDPFNAEVCILFSVQNTNTDNSKYPYALILKVFPISKDNQDEQKATLVREKYKSKFSFHLGKTKVSKWFAFTLKNSFILDYYY